MTFLEIQDAVLGTRFDTTQRTACKRWINSRYLWLWTRHEWPFKKVASTNLSVTAADTTPTIPTGMRNVLRIYDNTGGELVYQSPSDFDNMYQGSTQTGVPRDYTVINNAIYLGPSPAGAYTFKIVYESRVTPLSADADLPAWPREWDLILVPGAIATGLREENDPTANGVEEEFQMLYTSMVEDLLPPDQVQNRQFGRDNL